MDNAAINALIKNTANTIRSMSDYDICRIFVLAQAGEAAEKARAKGGATPAAVASSGPPSSVPNPAITPNAQSAPAIKTKTNVRPIPTSTPEDIAAVAGFVRSSPEGLSQSAVAEAFKGAIDPTSKAPAPWTEARTVNAIANAVAQGLLAKIGKNKGAKVIDPSKVPATA